MSSRSNDVQRAAELLKERFTALTTRPPRPGRPSRWDLRHLFIPDVEAPILSRV